MRLAALLVILCGVSSGADLFRPEALARNSPRFLWPNGIIPYVVNDDVPEQARITEAIAHWEENTPIRLVPRTDQTNYVRFVRQPGGCSSGVGMIGGEQRVNLDDGCTKAVVIHEIGHAVGLFHEHSRHDRDLYVRVMLQDADKREIGNLQQILTGSDDFGFYDYASIMHYTGLGFARTGRPPIQSIPPGIPVGRTEVLSLSCFQQRVAATSLSRLPPRGYGLQKTRKYNSVRCHAKDSSSMGGAGSVNSACMARAQTRCASV